MSRSMAGASLQPQPPPCAIAVRRIGGSMQSSGKCVRPDVAWRAPMLHRRRALARPGNQDAVLAGKGACSGPAPEAAPASPSATALRRLLAVQRLLERPDALALTGQ